MQVFLESLDAEVWKTTVKPNMEAELEVGVGPSTKTHQAHNRTKNAIFCALSQGEFNRISRCKTAYEMWSTLETVYEGTTKVKEAKLEVLTSQFENFKMLPKEYLATIMTKLTDILNSQGALGVRHDEYTLVKKILRSLTQDWNFVYLIMMNDPMLDKMTTAELVGSLKVHETRMNELKNCEKSEMKKSLAFQAKEETSEEEEEEDDEEIDDLETIAILTKRVKRFLNFRNKRNGEGSQSFARKKKTICYEYGDEGHISYYCPKKKKTPKNFRDREVKRSSRGKFLKKISEKGMTSVYMSAFEDEEERARDSQE